MIHLPFIYFTLLFLFFLYKQKAFNVGSYLTSIYMISSFFGILIDKYNLYDGTCLKSQISYQASFTYCLLITVSILPFYFFRNDLIVNISKPKLKTFNLLSYFFMAIFAIISILFIFDIYKIITSSFLEMRQEGVLLPSTGIKHFGKIILTLFSNFSPMLIFFYFYSVIFLKKSKLFNSALLASSLTNVISGVLVAGRTTSIYWILSFMLAFVFFKNLLSKELKIKFLKTIILVFIVLFAYLSLATISRWGNDEAINSLIVYIGQPYINFCAFFDNFQSQTITLNRIFPLITQVTSGKEFILADYRNSIFAYSDFNIGIFYTFLGDLLVDIGHLGVYIYVSIYFIISNFILRRNNKQSVDFVKILIFIILVHIPLHGVFYYSFYKVDVSYYIWISLVFMPILKYKFKFGHNEII